MNNTILDFAIIISGVIGYFISFSLVITSFYKSRANNYLSLTLFLLTTLTLTGSFDIENRVLDFIFNNVALEYLAPVTLFSYSLIQIKHDYLEKSWYKWLYIPFFIIIVLEAIYRFYPSQLDSLGYEYIIDNISFLYNVFLILWGRKLIKNSSVTSEDIKRWLLRLNLLIIFIILIWFLSNLERYILDSRYSRDFLWVGLSFLSWWVLYYGIFRLQLIVQKEEIHQQLVSKNIKSNLVKRKINETTSSKILNRLYIVMDEDEIYKNPLLSRLDIANKLETNEIYLSQVINQEMNKSVIQFVNEYRIEAAKSLLNNPVFNKYSLEALGMEAGFKSKSTFYSTFKKSVGMSPGAFRKLQKMS